MTLARIAAITALVAVLSAIVFFLPVWGLATLGLLVLAAWMFTVPLWLIQAARGVGANPRVCPPARPHVIEHDDGSIEVQP